MANAITLARLPALLLMVLLLYSPSPFLHGLCVLLGVIIVAMDSIDGAVARRRHEVSVFGGVLDIMVDRIVELVLWIVYAQLRLVSVAIPLVFAVRGVIVDTLRNTQVTKEVAPLQVTATRWGKFLVGSPAMRTTYAVVKLLAFAGLAATLAVIGFRGADSDIALELGAVSRGLSWLAAGICLARGLPVVIEVGGVLARRDNDAGR